MAVPFAVGIAKPAVDHGQKEAAAALGYTPYQGIFAKRDLAANALTRITVNDAARYADYRKLD